MSQVIESLHIPAELQTRAAHCAQLDGIPVERWMLEAIASKLETAEFFHRRAKGASGRSLGELLDAVPSNPPIPGDELPEEYERS
jgi:hypothetical protein